MPNYQAITRERHGALRWRRYTNYTYAAANSVVPLVAPELPKAVMSLPMAFIKEGDGFVPAAVLGLQPGHNLFVDTNWRWTGKYIPAAFRSFPFRLLKADTGQQVLCVDEESGLVGEGLDEIFFNDDGTPAQSVADILNFLTLTEQSRVATAVICAVLQKHNLICPWAITVKKEGSEQQIAGLFQIDEAALNQLSIDALFEIRQAGALPVAYCQLLSMQHLPMLKELFDAHAAATAQQLANQRPALTEAARAAFFKKGETISFVGLG